MPENESGKGHAPQAQEPGSEGSLGTAGRDHNAENIRQHSSSGDAEAPRAPEGGLGRNLTEDSEEKN